MVGSTLISNVDPKALFHDPKFAMVGIDQA
jgi:hypothetical protein